MAKNKRESQVASHIILYIFSNSSLAKTDNSRAARRAASPSLDVDKSLTTLPRAESPTTQRHSILSDRRNSGIQKKQKQKKLTRAQRLRQQKGMDRAEVVLDRLEIKKAKSASRQKTVKERRVCICYGPLVYLGYRGANRGVSH